MSARKRKDFIKTPIIYFVRAASTMLVGIALSAAAQTRTLRIVTYNLGADINGITAPQPGLIAPPDDAANYAAGGVLEGIGEEIVGSDPAQAIDILALEETTSNPQTVAPIANGLNTFYGVPGMFTNSTYQATESGGVTTSGNGPNAIVFNTRTVQLLASVPVDPPGGTSALGSSSGMYREVMRYQFAPAGVATNAANVFYVYVSHYKSGTGSGNEAARLGEAQIVRNNAATLPATARILYVGDFNTGVAVEGMYVTLIAPGTNQALDPVNPAGATNLTWDGNAALEVKTFSPVAIHYRDDYQMMTTNVYSGISGGLKFVPGTYHIFGNNGSIPYLANVTTNLNTALTGRLATNGPVFISATQLYTDLTNASDHLPCVADYTIPMPAPRITSFSLAGTNLTLTATNGITNAVYAVLMQTNVTAPLTNWTTLATYTVTSGVFTFTATNVVSMAAPGRFYILKGK
jgi:hypothetical protein